MSRQPQERDRLGLPAHGGSDTEVAGAIGGIARLRTGRFNKVSAVCSYMCEGFILFFEWILKHIINRECWHYWNSNNRCLWCTFDVILCMEKVRVELSESSHGEGWI